MTLVQAFLRIALKLLGPALLVYFLLTTDLEKLWSTLLRTDPILLGISAALLLPFLYLKGWRWQLILEAWDIKIGIADATALYGVGIFLGSMTPGQAGDAVKAWYLRQRGESLTAGLASVVLDRLFDVGIMGLLAASGLYFFWDILPGGKAVNVLTLAIMLAAVAAGLLVTASRRVRRFSTRLIPDVIGRRLNLAALEQMHLRPRQLGVIALVTAAGLAITFVRVYLLFLALDTSIPIGPFIALVAIIAIVSTASPGGVGVRDAVMVFVLTSLLNLSAADAQARAIAISTLLLVLTVLNILVGYPISLRYPLDVIRRQPANESLKGGI